MSIREKEEMLRKAARNWELAAEAFEKAGDHAQAAEARANAAASWGAAETAHPVGFLNAMATQAIQQEARNRNSTDPGEGFDRLGPRNN